MMQRIDLRGGLPARAELLRLMPRAVGDVSHAVDAARELVEAVRHDGADALREQAERFDGGTPANVRVPRRRDRRGRRRADPGAPRRPRTKRSAASGQRVPPRSRRRR